MWTLILLPLILAAIYAYWSYVQYKTGWHLLKKIPGPFTFWIFGNVPQIGLRAEEHMTQIRRWAHDYNYSLVRVYGGAQPYVMITNPKTTEQVLSSTVLIHKYDPYKFFYPWLGQGLLTANGKHWVNHRKMITPSFHFAILQDFLKIMNETSDRFVELLAGFATKMEMFDFQEVVTRSTIDVICEAAMGTPVNAIQGPTSPIVPAIADICDVMRQRIFSALNRFDFFFVWTRAYQKQEKALTVLRKEFSQIIDKRRDMLKTLDQNKLKLDVDGKRPKMAFLDNLLTAEVDGKPLTFQEIFEEASTFMFEGHDTTASAIGFAIYCLSRHPEIQSRAFQEQYAIFGNDVKRSPTFQELSDMKYMELVIKETLRLFPSVPFIVRTLLEQTEIGGFQIPPGTSLGFCIIAMGTNPQHFPAPFEFKPERFENRNSSNPYDYIPFSAGPRNCIGQKFAMMELKVTLSKIIRHFNILPAVDGLSTGIHDPADRNDKINNPYDARLGFFLTLKSVNGLNIRLKHRVQVNMLLLLLYSVLLAPILALLYLEVKNYSKVKQLKRLPGPPALPVLGNAHQMGKTPSELLNQLFRWWQEADHHNYRVIIGPYRNMIVSDANDMEFILTSKSLIDKSDIYDMLHPWLGTGLLTSTGRKWHTHRKIITPSFHFKILQNFHDVMNKNSNKFVEILRKVSQNDAIFDFQDMTHYLTMDVICDTAMGVHINAMDNHDHKLVQAFKDMCYNINMRAFHPLKRSNILYRFSPDYPKYSKTLKTLQDFTNEVITKRRETLKLEKTEGEENEFSRKKQAFLDTLLSSTIDGKSLTQHEIYEEVSTFMFEGHDTTTSGVAFTVYLLAMHSEIQRKVYAEQQQLLGDNFKDEATFQQISDMQYLDMVIKESLRLYPSVPFVSRRCDKDYDINGFVVPVDTTINLFLMALGYNEKYFPDPYRVDPDRWGAKKRTQNPFEYLPFSAGPRNCIGQKFALLEIKTVVSKVVRTFEILPPLDELASTDGYSRHFIGLSQEEQRKRLPNPSKYDPILSAVLTLKSENGISIRLRERP
nr:uncharacterized protein LOC106622644 [Bactrocera oleae]